jgi:release factor glutamine methyltransferase
MTILQAIQRSADFLARKGVESPRLQVELMLAQLLSMPRMNLYLAFERPLAEAELTTLRTMVTRRGQREPLQHILGSTSFCGLELAVDGRVLVPRPETELLAERGWRFIQTLASRNGGPPTVLDFGTGSGCIAIAIAANCPSAIITAVDISPDALAVAMANADRHGVSDRIKFQQIDRNEGLPALLKFDLLVSNPPYIPSAQIDALQPEVSRHDPRMALDGGEDGLDFYRRLAIDAPALLRPGGHLMLELGDGQSASVRDLFAKNGWTIDAIEKDYSGTERVLIARRV